MNKGGFDAVVGNPPYVEYSKIRKDYQVRGFATERCGNIAAFCSERALQLTKRDGRFCFIVPLSIQTTKRMSPLQEYLLNSDRELWMSSFDVYPSKLFEGAKQRLTILLTSTEKRRSNHVWTTRYLRWKPEERATLFARLAYSRSGRNVGLSVFQKSDGVTANQVLSKLSGFGLETFIRPQSTQIYVHRIPYNYVKAINFVPYYKNESIGEKDPTIISPIPWHVRH